MQYTFKSMGGGEFNLEGIYNMQDFSGFICIVPIAKVLQFQVAL